MSEMDALGDAAPSGVHELYGISDTVERIRRASELVAQRQEEIVEISRIRREDIMDLAAEGHTQTDMAKMLRMTRSRIQQLLTSGPKIERALLGTGSLTVSIGGKWEAGKDNPSAVISTEALGAFRILSELADDYNLTAAYDVVPPPGMVRLNKNNLIVIGSPRILPIVGPSLEADENLRFEQGAQGWYLRNLATGDIYRSPNDRGSTIDFAYIGRLPRPDGKGTFLYLAGIHAMGTLGAAQFLANNIHELYAKVKNKRWSMLVESAYDPDSRQIVEVRQLGELYVVA